MLSYLKNRGKGNAFFLIDNSFTPENTFLYLLYSLTGIKFIRIDIPYLFLCFLLNRIR
jgi:hypothetical protein